MSSTHATATAGDVGQYRETQLGETVDGVFTPTDFTSLVASVEAHVWPRYLDTATVTLAASFTAPATGTLRVDLGAADGWLAGLASVVPRGRTYEYLIAYEVTFTDTSVRTYGPDVLPVEGQGA